MSTVAPAVAAVVCRLAGLPAIGPDEDIYDAGVSSIQALELLTELEDTLSVSLPDEAFVQARTVSALTALIESRRAG